MTQNICNQYPEIVSRIAFHYGWDKPQEQCLWMIQSLASNGRTPWQAFSYLVEACLQMSDDRELDYLWFDALKQHEQVSKAA